MTEWSIEFSPKAEKELFSFAYNVSDRIMDKLKETRANPLSSIMSETLLIISLQTFRIHELSLVMQRLPRMYQVL